MTFPPGHTLSPGRRPGSRNKRTEEILTRLENRGDIDPADFLSSIVSNNEEPKELRIQASGLLLPYKHSKCGTIPAARYIELQIDVNEFTHVSDAENFLAKIALLTARGHLDIQSAQELSGLVKAWIDTQYAKEELQFKINPPEQRDTVIRVEGGLPIMPGLEGVVMPQINGATNGHDVLAPPAPQIESSGKESSTNGQGPGTPDSAPETKGGEP
jgi:hypothetical protein